MFPPKSNISAVDFFFTTMVVSNTTEANRTNEDDDLEGLFYDDVDGHYPFHRTEVKVPLLVLYTLVFIFAFFGKYNTSPMYSRVHIYVVHPQVEGAQPLCFLLDGG